MLPTTHTPVIRNDTIRLPQHVSSLANGTKTASVIGCKGLCPYNVFFWAPACSSIVPNEEGAYATVCSCIEKRHCVFSITHTSPSCILWKQAAAHELGTVWSDGETQHLLLCWIVSLMHDETLLGGQVKYFTATLTSAGCVTTLLDQ